MKPSMCLFNPMHISRPDIAFADRTVISVTPLTTGVGYQSPLVICLCSVYQSQSDGDLQRSGNLSVIHQSSVVIGRESRRIGSEGAADELGERFSCSGVMPGRLEVWGLGRGTPGILTDRATE